MDLYRWSDALDRGALINDSSFAEIFPTDRRAPGIGFGTGRFKVVMGLGWFYYQSPYGPEYSHGGHVDGFSSAIARYPSQDAVIIILSNQDQFDVWTLKDRLAEIYLGKL